MEGGQFFSFTLRQILKSYHQTQVGRYSYGPCLVPYALPAGTIVGSYCSLANELKMYRRNHPTTTLTQHPFFFNGQVGLLGADSIENIDSNPCRIGNDVWIGDRVLIMPACQLIGDGAIVGAGSVVTRDVEPFTVVAGNPARMIRKRFSDEIIEELQRSRWWDLTLTELLEANDLLLSPVSLASLRHFNDNR